MAQGFPVPGQGTAIKSPPSGGSDNVKFQAGSDSKGPYGNDPTKKGFDGTPGPGRLGS